MSRIGTKPIQIPETVTVTMTDNVMTFNGPKGELNLTLHPKADVKINDGIITVDRHGNDRLARSIHGLTRMLVANSVEGVHQGFLLD